MDLPQNEDPKLIVNSKSLKDQLKISKIQLHEYATNESKFQKKIKELNALGAHYINEDFQKQALNYLLQAQMILQYVANCGRTIDRILITTTLQNLAYAYQKLDDLQRANDYMEAILSNTQSNLDLKSTEQINQKIIEDQSDSQIEFSLLISKKLESVFYYLQYSGLNSQVNHHNLAIESARSALKALENICKACMNYQKIKKGKNSFIMECLVNSFEMKETNLKTMLQDVKIVLNQVQMRRHFFSFDISLIQNFMIGEIMQIGTITVEQKLKRIKIQDKVSHLALIYKTFYLSICYFVIATEFRFLSLKQNKEVQYQLAQLHHLYAIKIVASIIPYQSKYLTHLIHSYKNHYNLDLTQEKGKDQQNQEEKNIVNPEQNLNTKTQQIQNEGKSIKNICLTKKNPITKSKKALKLLKGIKERQNPQENPVYVFPKKRGFERYQRDKIKEMKLSAKNGEVSSHSSKRQVQAFSLKKNQIEKSNRQYLFNEFKGKKKKNKRESSSKSKEKCVELSTDRKKKKQ